MRRIMSSEETKYIHHSLNIDPAEVTVANEVSAEAEIAIELGKLFWVGHGGTENPIPNRVGVFCETEEEAEKFRRAFKVRRWEDQKGTGE
jgi:hypothetical protein